MMVFHESGSKPGCAQGALRQREEEVAIQIVLAGAGCKPRQAQERVANVESQVQQAEALAREAEDSTMDAEETSSGCRRMPWPDYVSFTIR